MISQKVCQYYSNARCLLEGGYCDLDCDRTATEDSKPRNSLPRWSWKEEPILPASGNMARFTGSPVTNQRE